MIEDIRKMPETKGIAAFERKWEKPHVILVDSQYCSMGRMIAINACKDTDYTYYDSVLLLESVSDTDITMQDVQQFEQKLRKADIDLSLQKDIQFLKIKDAFATAITKAVGNGRCLIHDRASKGLIESLGVSFVSVMIRNSGTHTKCIRASRSPLYQNISDENLLIRYIEEEDHIRRNYKKLCGEDTWNQSSCYDLIIDSETLSKDLSSTILHQLMI